MFLLLLRVLRGGHLFGYIIKGRRRDDEQEHEKDCPEFGSVHQLIWHIDLGADWGALMCEMRSSLFAVLRQKEDFSPPPAHAARTGRLPPGHVRVTLPENTQPIGLWSGPSVGQLDASPVSRVGTLRHK